MAATVDNFGDNITAKFYIVYKYLELEPIGPIIGGDIVFQGVTTTTTHRPALCRVEYQADDEEDFNEIAKIAPWEMMVSLPEADGEACNFAIPISLGTNYNYGKFKFSIYVDENKKVHYRSPKEEYDIPHEGLICAVEYIVAGTEAEDRDEDDIDKDFSNIPVVSDIKIISTKGKTAKIPKSFTNNVLTISKDGIRESSATSLWPYHIYTKMGSRSKDGIEDMIWLRTPKDIGILPEVPEGYAIYEDADFSVEKNQVFIICSPPRSAPFISALFTYQTNPTPTHTVARMCVNAFEPLVVSGLTYELNCAQLFPPAHHANRTNFRLPLCNVLPCLCMRP